MVVTPFDSVIAFDATLATVVALGVVSDVVPSRMGSPTTMPLAELRTTTAPAPMSLDSCRRQHGETVAAEVDDAECP